MANRFVKDPHEIVKTGRIVKGRSDSVSARIDSAHSKLTSMKSFGDNG
jgi:hypothetical protein